MTDAGEEPVHLVEDAETGDRFLVYETGKGPRLDIRYEGETLWMTQAQIAELFGVERSVVTKHIANVYAEGELEAEATSAKIAQVRQEGSRTVERQLEHYNLDAVISVGYRVSSAQATVFRRWATGVLVQFARKGFVVDAPRLKQPDNADRVAELREIIRDIRSDEANVYRELRRICELNRLTTILVDIFEDQLDLGRLVVMQDAQRLLDQQLSQLGRVVLRSGGSVKAADAKRLAEAQYDKFDRQRKLERHQEADERIAALATEARNLPKSPRR
jgi:hypothetical protein